jgi:hypothetical protein
MIYLNIYMQATINKRIYYKELLCKKKLKDIFETERRKN